MEFLQNSFAKKTVHSGFIFEMGPTTDDSMDA
jgi:hypothetical protein